MPTASHRTARHQGVVDELFRRYDRLALAAFRDIAAESKPDGSTITRVDREVSRVVLSTLKAHTPEFGILSEEEPEAYRPEAPWQWVVDPLDGTASFARGYPVWGLGIGLMHRGAPHAGYIHFPVLGETFACDGAGLHFNGRPLAPPGPPLVRDTENLLFDSTLHRQFASLAALHHYKLRIFGSNLYHMAALATGRAEAMICGRVYLWDLAAGLPMTRFRGFTERYADGSAFDLGELTRANRYRVRLPLVIGPPERVETIVDGLRRAL